MNKAIKYRLYPTTEQAVLFIRTFGCCRKVYNLMLEDKIKTYESTKTFGKQTPAMYKEDYPFLREVDSLALANVQLNLQKAISSCFDKSRKKKNRFPRFKSAKHSRKSYKTNNQDGTVAITEKGVKLPKVGIVKAKIHRLPENDWQLKSATISQESDGKFYVSILFKYKNSMIPVPKTNNAVGLDYASDSLYVDDKGNIGTNHKYYRESHKKLARQQRKLSRMAGSKKGETKSHRYLKQLAKVNRIHRHIANQRLDNLHKLSTEIANQYDIVCVEDLNMKALSNRYFGNGKATLDNGYGLFLKLLEYKLVERGKYLIKVDRFFPSSQICHCCGERHPEMKDLRIRTIKCDCGLSMNRDQNAAINIKQEGLRILHEELAS